MMSPERMPAARAAPSGAVASTRTPLSRAELVEAHDAARQRDVLPGKADIGAPHPAVADQPRRRTNSTVLARDREADALRAAMIAVLMPITSPAAVDQRAAGIAGIERGVGLDDAVDEPARSGRAACGRAR